MKKVLLIALVIISAMGIGCRHRSFEKNAWKPQAMTPPVKNTLRAGTFSAHVSKQIASKTFALDLQNVPEIYRDEISFYVTNVLSYKGLRPAAQSTCVISVALQDTNIGLTTLRGTESRMVILTITAAENGQACWDVTVKARGQAEANANGWLPGLVAIAYQNLGLNHNGIQSIKRIPIAMENVYNNVDNKE